MTVDSSQVSIVVPAYDECAAIVATLERLRERLPDAEIIVVDDGSTDGTGALALGVRGVSVIDHEFNRGYGASLKTGMARATREFVAWFDADDEHSVDDLEAMCARMQTERLAAVLGERPSAGRGTTVRRIGKLTIWLLAWALDARLGRDVNCGLRVFRRREIERLAPLLPDGFSASLTSTMLLASLRLPIAFHPVTRRPRVGISKVRLRHGFSTLMLVVRMVTALAPLRLYFRVGGVLLAVGAAYSLVIAVLRSEGVPVGGVLLSFVGLVTMAIGLLADQLSQLRVLQVMSRPGHELTYGRTEPNHWDER